MKLERSIPICFITKYYQLTWSDCYLGLIESWLTLDDVIKYALNKIECKTYSEDEFALASLYSYERDEALSILEKLSKLDKNKSDSKTAWLKIILLWVFEKNPDVSSLQKYVESIYEDFSYPEEISHLIKYNVNLYDIDSGLSWECFFLNQYIELLYEWFGYEKKLV